ncbi:MAG: hypothetical protein ACRDHZ_10765 [Ktedonobacteraceae bacterium]
MGVYDHAMKVIVDASPEAVVQFVLHQWCVTQGQIPPENSFKVLAQLNTEFQGSEAAADGLLLVELANGQQILVHIEFQSKHDKHMPDRLLDYCLRARRKHGSLPIISCVVYLRDDGPVEEPPWCWSVTEQYANLAFDYVCIKLWEIPREDVLALQQPVLLPLSLLAKGEVNRIIVRDMFEELRANKLNDLMLPGQIVAGWLLQGDDFEWLKKEYAKMASIFEDSPLIEWIKEDTLIKALEQAREEVNRQVAEERQRALEERQRALKERQRALEGFQQAVVAIVSGRYPKLARLAQKQVRQVENQEHLQQLIRRISVLNNAEDVEELLLDLDSEEQSEPPPSPLA